MAPIRRKWTPAAACEWSRKDWITIVLATSAYIGLAEMPVEIAIRRQPWYN